jgi:acetoacetate decarboxylase
MTSERATDGIFYPDSGVVKPLTAALVRQNGYAMPFHSPSYIRPNAFLNRPALSVTYRMDLELAEAIVPEPLAIKGPLVSLGFSFFEGDTSALYLCGLSYRSAGLFAALSPRRN